MHIGKKKRMKRKRLIVVILVLVLLCASSVSIALANAWCDHDATTQVEERFTSESSKICEYDESCTVTEICTWYDMWCPKCLEDVGYIEVKDVAHTGVNCSSYHEENFHREN